MQCCARHSSHLQRFLLLALGSASLMPKWAGGGGGGGKSTGSVGGTMSVAPSSGIGSGKGSGSSMPMGSSQVQTMGPKGPSGKTWTGANWNGGQWGHHRHHRHNRFFFGAGFAGPYYDYGYDSCWRIVPTYYGGWQRVWVCGDYPYGGYYGGY